MIATNHTITGVLVAAVLPHPIVALPLALTSHLVLDALPHLDSDAWVTSPRYKVLLGSDASLAAAVLLLLIIVQPAHWLLMVGCGIIAAAPDIIWLPYWLAELKGHPKKFGMIAKWLAWIQWGAVPWGWVFEVAYLLPALTLFGKVLSSNL